MHNKLVEVFDFYGTKPELNFKNKEVNKTLYGSIVSIIVIIIFSVSCYIYGKELIERQKPIIIKSERYVLSPQRMEFDNTQQTFMVGIRNQLNGTFNDPSIYTVEARYVIMKKTYNETSKLYQLSYDKPPLKMRKCKLNEVKLKELQQYFNEVEYNQFMCFDDNQEVYIEGDVSADKFRKIEVFIKQCSNSTNSVVCAPQEKIDKALQSSVFYGYMFDKFVDSTNIEKPFLYKPLNLYSPVSNKLGKGIDYNFSNQYIYTDVGLFNEDIQEVRDFILGELIESISFGDQNLVIKITLKNVKNRETIVKRRYMKISDLIAQLGGILKLLIIMGTIIALPIGKLQLNKEIVNSIFDFEEEQQENKNSKQQSISQNIENKKEEFKSKINQNEQIPNQKYSTIIRNQSIKFYDKYTQQISKQIDEKQIRLLHSKFQKYKKQDDSNNKINKEINHNEVNNSQIATQKSISQQIHQQENQKILDIKDEVDLFITKQTEGQQIYDHQEESKQVVELQKINCQNLENSIIQWAKDKVEPVRKIINYNNFEYLQHVFFPCSRRVRQARPLIEKSMKIVRSHLDIQYILNKFQEVDKLKQILLTDDQIKLFELIPRPLVKQDISQNRLIINTKYFEKNKSYEEKYDDGFRSLLNILSKEKRSQRDLRLIELLDENLWSLIENQQNYKTDSLGYAQLEQFANFNQSKLTDSVQENSVIQSEQLGQKSLFSHQTTINKSYEKLMVPAQKFEYNEEDNIQEYDENDKAPDRRLKNVRNYKKSSLN